MVEQYLDRHRPSARRQSQEPAVDLAGVPCRETSLRLNGVAMTPQGLKHLGSTPYVTGARSEVGAPHRAVEAKSVAPFDDGHLA